jgi:transposase
MIAPGMGLRILVATQPVDFRHGMDSLAVLVSEALRDDPFCGALFVFRSKRADRIKILAWDGTGLCLYSKRLENGRFIWPPIRDGSITLSAAQLSSLIDGLDWRRLSTHVVKRPSRAG